MQQLKKVVFVGFIMRLGSHLGYIGRVKRNRKGFYFYLKIGFFRKMLGSELNFDLMFLRLGFSETVEM